MPGSTGLNAGDAGIALAGFCKAPLGSWTSLQCSGLNPFLSTRADHMESCLVGTDIELEGDDLDLVNDPAVRKRMPLLQLLLAWLFVGSWETLFS